MPQKLLAVPIRRKHTVRTAAGVICEVLDDEGGMARLPELFKLARTHGLKVITIKDLIEYRMQ